VGETRNGIREADTRGLTHIEFDVANMGGTGAVGKEIEKIPPWSADPVTGGTPG
jgi:hypothetical protein